MSFTVVPLNNIDIPTGSHIPFGDKFVLQDVPDWLKQDQNYLKDLSRDERELVLAEKHALVSEYYANTLGFPDSEWKGPIPRSIQKFRIQSAILANMSIWLIQPTPLRFTMGFHALTVLDTGQEVDPPLIIQSPREPPLWAHPRDGSNPLLPKHLVKAAALYERLSTVPRKNDVWAALRAFWAALVSYPPDQRYPLFWQGLESLFGSEDDNPGLSRRLRERISYFLAEDATTQQSLHDMVKRCYKTRSEIVHGRWDQWDEIEDRMCETESIVRTVVRSIANGPGMLEVFLSPKRDDFLEAMVQSKSFSPPASGTTSHP
jgi:hypothetical protein